MLRLCKFRFDFLRAECRKVNKIDLSCCVAAGEDWRAGGEAFN